LGDAEDDASSTKSRSMLSLLGVLLAEVSLPKLVLAWTMLIGLPGLLLGAVPLFASIWIGEVSSQVSDVLNGIWPALALILLLAVGWKGGRRLARVAESSFWSLNALAVQPGYALCRESLRHLAERKMPAGLSQDRRATVRAIFAAAAGILVCGIGLLVVGLAWPATRWVGSPADLVSPYGLLVASVANGVVIIAGYCAAASLFWGVADATMPQPRDLDPMDLDPVDSMQAQAPGGRRWRVAHLSDLHVVGERYGFRIESGRAGPRGNERFRRVLARLNEIHEAEPLDLVLITGDLTDAGRSAEWVEFFDGLAQYPALQKLVVALPGNHDVNVVDRANPARLHLPLSPTKRLRQLRMISALEALQGTRVQVVDHGTGRPLGSLSEVLRPHIGDIRAFSDRGPVRLSGSLEDLWTALFPMVVPPEAGDGLGVILLNSNAESHFSFTNALGTVTVEQARAIDTVVRFHPGACWIVALHHHLVEYPMPAKALSERIGTALVNGSWFVRRLQGLADRAVVMHGHRHVDWIGACGRLVIVSGPSPVMDATDRDDTHFHVHTLLAGEGGRLRLLRPVRVEIGGRPAAAVS
jgi:hypothetical protein